ncbi:phage tail protein, partial [Martelella sp. HB161492]|uniref:phage tail protein n=1 Tax=Martelella sp. HB161492 TaxID=2720726 RepID=UPI0015916CD4
GVSLIQKALTKSSTSDTAAETGVTLSVQMGDDQPVTFFAGRYATAGRRKYAGTWGEDGNTPNAFFVDVIELTNLPVSGLNAVWAGDDKVTLLTGEEDAARGFPVSEYRVDGTDYLWVKFYDGSQTTADAYLVDKFGGNADRPYGNDRIGRGCAYAIVTCRYNTDLFSGVPSMLFEVGSILLYDPRADTSAGGEGDQRWDDAATWAPSNNLAVIIYNVIRGVYYGDQWIYGGQDLSAYRLPFSNWAAAMNECDALVDDGNGNMVAAYQGGYEFSGDERPLDAIEKLRQACNARLAEVGGIFKIQVGAPGSAVYAFTDDDVVITKGQTFNPHGSLDDTVNAIEATYPEPDEKWSSKDAPGRYDDTLEADDGDRRLPASVSFEACPYGAQVQRLMLAMLQDARRFRTHQIWLPPEAWPLEPNDVVSWTSLRNGYSAKKFLVIAASAPMNANVLVSLKEIDPADYDWSAADALPTVTGWIGTIEAPYQQMTGWTVEPATMADGNGIGRLAAIRVSCGAGIDGVTGVVVQVRERDSGDVIFSGHQSAYEDPYSWIIGPLPPLTWVEARGRFVSDLAIQEWSEWLAVETPNVSSLIADLDALGEDVKARMEEMQSELDDIVGRRLADISAALSLQGSVGLLERVEVRQQIGDAIAEIVTEQLVRASEDEALAQTLTLVGAEVTAATAAVAQETTARAAADEALAEEIDTMSVSLNDSFAGGQIAFRAAADQSGVSARYSVMLRAGTGGDYIESGFFLELYNDGGTLKSRFAVSADQFVVLDSNSKPLVYENGTLKIYALLAGSLNINNLVTISEAGQISIKSASSGQRLEINNSLVQVYDGNGTLRVRMGIW